MGLLLAPVGAGSAAAQTDEPLRLPGAHYELYSHVGLPGVAREALRAAETTWPLALALYGGPAAEPPTTPLPVHLYRDPAGYEAAEAALTGGRFRRNLAFAHWDTRTAHVAVQPALDINVLRRRGLNAQTLRLLVHEASHLARFWSMPNYRAHPSWFADGNATWIETEVLRRLGRLAEIEDDPVFSTYVVRVQRRAAAGSLPTVPELLADEVGELSFSEVYAARWLLFRFLMSGPREPAMRATIADMRRFGGGGNFTARVTGALRRQLGTAEFAALDGEFRAFVGRLQPRWEEIFRALDTHNGKAGEWLQTAFPTANAIAWRTEPAGPEEYEIRGALTVLVEANRQLNLLLDRSEHGFVSVAFTAGRGVTVFEYVAAEQHFVRLDQLVFASLRPNRRFEFCVRVAADNMITIEGGNAADGSGPERSLRVRLSRPPVGPWGVGAQAGTSGVWQGVELVR